MAAEKMSAHEALLEVILENITSESTSLGDGIQRTHTIEAMASLAKRMTIPDDKRDNFLENLNELIDRAGRESGNAKILLSLYDTLTAE